MRFLIMLKSKKSKINNGLNLEYIINRVWAKDKDNSEKRRISKVVDGTFFHISHNDMIMHKNSKIL